MKKSIIISVLFVILSAFNLSASSPVEALEKKITTVSEVANKSVVFIKVKKETRSQRQDHFHDFFNRFGNRRPQQKSPQIEGLGSGFVIDDQKGYIVTNSHVIHGAQEIEVTVNNHSYKAKLIGDDPKTDIGLIQLLNFKKKDIKALLFADSDKIKVGSFAIAIGNPFGLSKSVSFGIISAKGRSGMRISEYENFIQTDAAINPGNSGGPLLNIKGKVIGMNTAIFSKSGGYMGIGFAVPSNMVKKITISLKSGKKIQRALLGVSIQTIQDNLKKQFSFPADKKGVLITAVAQKSPAEKAGIKPGDVIIRFNNKDVVTAARLKNSVAFTPFNKKVPVELYRDGKKKKLMITLITSFQFPTENNSVKEKSTITNLGLNIAKKRGHFIIVTVRPNSLAHYAGLRKGDKILSVNRKKIKSLKQLRTVLKNLDTIILYIEREGRKSYFVIN